MRRLLRSWRWRVAVSGHSMEPTLRDGDWLLVDPAAHAQRAPKMGDLVVARDPRAPERLIVKRVAGVAADGLRLAGDHPAHADDAGLIGPLTTAPSSSRGCHATHPAPHMHTAAHRGSKLFFTETSTLVAAPRGPETPTAPAAGRSAPRWGPPRLVLWRMPPDAELWKPKQCTAALDSTVLPQRLNISPVICKDPLWFPTR